MMTASTWSRFGKLTLCSLIGGVVFSTSSSAQQQRPGLEVRGAPSDYAASVKVDGATYAASLLTPDQLKNQFAFDISKSYLVFEVAVYPSTASALTLDPDAFLARSAPKTDPARPSDATTVASAIQQKNLPPPSSGRSAPVAASAGIGYESARDPVTGQRVHGTYTDTQVAVGSPGSAPPDLPGPGGYPQDRELLERQLWAKSLPEGQINHPVAGYLYFPLSLLKKKGHGEYELAYATSSQEPVLNGASAANQIVLHVPAARKH